MHILLIKFTVVNAQSYKDWIFNFIYCCRGEQHKADALASLTSHIFAICWISRLDWTDMKGYA